MPINGLLAGIQTIKFGRALVLNLTELGVLGLVLLAAYADWTDGEFDGARYDSYREMIT